MKNDNSHLKPQTKFSWDGKMQLLKLEFCQLISMQNITGLDGQKVLGPLLSISEDTQLSCSKYKNLGELQRSQTDWQPSCRAWVRSERCKQKLKSSFLMKQAQGTTVFYLHGSAWWKESRDRVQNLFPPQAQNAKIHFGPNSGPPCARALALTNRLPASSAP